MFLWRENKDYFSFKCSCQLIYHLFSSIMHQWILFCYINTILSVFHFELGGCATIPESDLEERTIIPGSTAMFSSNGQITKQKSKPGKKSKIMLFHLEVHSSSFQNTCGHLKQMAYISAFVGIISNFSCYNSTMCRILSLFSFFCQEWLDCKDQSWN